MHRHPPPTLRVLPTPAWEPPYDDDPPPRHPARRPALPQVQGTLALAFALPSGLPADPDPPPLRLVDGLPEPRSWSARIAQAVIEVMAGDRPVAQLVRWTSPEVHDQVARRARLAARAGSAARQAAPRAVVRSVRLCSPTEGVVEASAVVSRGGRVNALALRLERADGRWRCTALETG